ncbi:MAG: 7-cyano-7-deazaguanine synthase [Patescibacteria group bacterium]|nr:7-cyano-7-deazaguanine synthase [Patescibacteria group bacterium]
MDDCTQNYNEVVPIYVKTGLFWENSELYWLKRFLHAIHSSILKELVILDFPVDIIYKSHWSITGLNTPGFNDSDETVYLPGRNILLLSISGIYCVTRGLETIALGSLSGNPFPDATDLFFRNMEGTLQSGMAAKFSIITPFRSKKKSEVIERGKHLPLELTFSCVNPQDNIHCGMCSKCAERIHAFQKTGIEDKTIYKQTH